MVASNHDLQGSDGPEDRSPRAFEIGAVLSSKYLIERRLGSGGMGTIFGAVNLVVNRRVAIKVMHPMFAESPDLVGRFRTEARAAATVGHPNIVDILDMGQTDEGLPYLVMEHLEGEDLFERLARRGPLPAAESVCLVRQLLEALEAAHSVGVIHCDLKPENVFLATRAGRCDIAKILDFGAARFADDAAAARAWAWDDLVVGTPAYMSPEQASGSLVDHRTDIYSIGVMLYEMLSGATPYDGSEQEILEAIQAGPPPSLLELAPHVDPALGAIVDRAMAREATERWPSARALSAALAPWDNDVDASSMPIPLVRRRTPVSLPVRLPLQWHPLRWLATGAIIAAVALLSWRGPLRPWADRAGGTLGAHLLTRADRVPGVSPSEREAPPARTRFSIATLAAPASPPYSEAPDWDWLATPVDGAAAAPADEEPAREPRRAGRRAAPRFRRGVLYGGPPPTEDVAPALQYAPPVDTSGAGALDEDEPEGRPPSEPVPFDPAPLVDPGPAELPSDPDPAPYPPVPIPPSPYDRDAP